ncbi:MAG: DUF6364 family protein [Mucilaginibacter sp.]|uniref:DUF6364 family protein n=1 Tax=Mucilaginibacter sp. TaxID=1882438 RepID=UPI0034E46400
MQTKLTLKLDEEIIQQAKEYASNIIKISPFVKSLSSGTKIPVDLDYKKEYANYLIEKYR